MRQPLRIRRCPRRHVNFLFLRFTFLIPRSAAVLTEIKVKMPWLTRVFLDMSAFMSSHAWTGWHRMVPLERESPLPHARPRHRPVLRPRHARAPGDFGPIII